MKFSELENMTAGRLVIKSARLTFELGETKKVHPSTVKHPSVAALIGSALRIVTQGEAPQAEPKAPEQTTPDPLVEPPSSTSSEPNATDEEKTTESGDDSTAESKDKSSGTNLQDEDTAEVDLRSIYVSAPGVTDNNVDAILEAYPSIDQLKTASKSDLTGLGVHKSQAKKLISWVSNQ